MTEHEVELVRLSDSERLSAIRLWLEGAIEIITVDEEIDARSQSLEQLGFGLYDAFHLSCAEVTQVDVFLTTDDRLLKRAQRFHDEVQVSVDNPVTWLIKTLQEEQDDNEPN